MTSKVVLHRREIAQLAEHLAPKLLPIGDRVAERAARDAPKRTGEGARSIRAEVFEAQNEVRVSWDNDHYYMLFQEVGTSRQPARPFLRPALEAHYNL